jgi:4-amino-4-deoxy-L-arabinose transferase-like glycosyltransferase
MVSIYRATGGTFFTEAVGGDLLPKLVGGQESHGAPPGTYLVLVFATFWPASLFLWPAMVRGVKQRLTPEIRFLLAWIVPTWIVFELIPTKLPHYVLPVYPALALLAAQAVIHARKEPVFSTRLALANRVVWAAIALVLSVMITALAPILEGRILPLSLLPSAAGVVSAGVVWIYLRRRRPVRASAAALAGAVLVLSPTFFGVFPSLTPLWLSREAARTATALSAAGSEAPAVAAVGYHEPSLVFHLGTETLLTDSAGAARFLKPGEGRIAIVADSFRDDFLKKADQKQVPVRETAQVRGFNYTKGRWVTLHFFARAPDPGADRRPPSGNPPAPSG